MKKERIAILGASRGLGLALARRFAVDQNVSKLLLISRQRPKLENFSLEDLQRFEIFQADFTRDQEQERSLQALKGFEADRIFYVAGGGPHGEYAEKDWKDHLWAYQLNLLYPGRLIHWALQKGRELGLQQLTLVGSSLAENSTEPKGPSYGSAKIGLKALIQNVNASQTDFDLRLFSPGYIDTDLLPPGASVRRGEKIWEPEQVAQKMDEWSKSSDHQGHRSLPPFFSQDLNEVSH